MLRILKSIYCLMLLLLLSLFYATSCDAQDTNTQLIQDLLKLEQALNVGVKNHDTAALKNIIAREYQLTGPRVTQPVPHEKWLVNCFQWSFDSATHSNISVTNWEEVAVFRSLQH